MVFLRISGVNLEVYVYTKKAKVLNRTLNRLDITTIKLVTIIVVQAVLT